MIEANKLFEMEVKYRLFDLKTDDGIFVWDLFRYEIYMKNTYPEIKLSEKPISFTLETAFAGFFILFRSFFSFLFKKSEILIFSHSKYYNKEGLLFDKAVQNIVNILHPNVLIIERIKALMKYQNKAEYNLHDFFCMFILREKPLPSDIYETIKNAFFETFGELNESYSFLNDIYLKYKKDYRYYRFYFKLKKAKQLFLDQDGIQKGMLAAANSLGIITYELQHGSFGKDHFAYSYPDPISSADNIIIPDYFLTMGKSWTANINMPARKVVLGNDFFVSKKYNEESDHSLLFISSIIHGEALSKVAVEYAKLFPNTLIKFKLHSNEYFKENDYKNQFINYQNIQVLKNEIDLGILIARSELVVLINSTVLYEALDQGAKVAVLKVLNYKSQSDCFDLPNVFLFDAVDELVKAVKAEKKESKTTFFEKFNKDVFINLMNNI